MLICLVTQNEIKKVTKNLRITPSAGSDEILDYVVKQRIWSTKKPLVYVHSASLEFCTFPDKLKSAKAKTTSRKGDKSDIKIYILIPILFC